MRSQVLMSNGRRRVGEGVGRGEEGRSRSRRKRALMIWIERTMINIDIYERQLS
jgi:hypothetical protein